MYLKNYNLKNKTAVVTGAGKGIGRGITLQLARAGADVVISSRTEDDLTSLVNEVESMGRKATPVLCDVTQTAELENLAETAVTVGGIDIWVNNAGGLPDATPRYLTRTPEDRWDAQMNLNLKAVFIACQVAAANMTEGAIINISSSSAKAQGNIKNGHIFDILSEHEFGHVFGCFLVPVLCPGLPRRARQSAGARFPAGPALYSTQFG